MHPSSSGDVPTTAQSTVSLIKNSLLYIKKLTKLNFFRDVNGSTLLHLAASSGSTHIVETLLNVAGYVLLLSIFSMYNLLSDYGY